MSQSFRHAIRTLLKSRGFAAVTVLLTGLGIGATTTLFSLLYGVLMKPLPWPEPDRLLRLEETRGGKHGRVPWTISNTTYYAWREHPETIDELGGWMRAQLMTVTAGAGEPERLPVGRVTPSLLRVLRVRPLEGQIFTDDDVAGGSGPGVVILGYNLWQDRFGGDPAMVGRSFRLDDRLMTVVGVMPKDFAFPDRETQAWLPMGVARVTAGANVISGQIFNALARLRPGATVQQASSEGTARGRAAPTLGPAGIALFGGGGPIAVTAVPARDALTADVKPALVMLLAAVALIFATAIASVLVLQTARVAKRRREIAVRMAIGAGAGHLLRQWLLESAILGVDGGIAGLVLAATLHRILPAILPPDFPRLDAVTVDVRVGLFCAALTAIVILVCGLVPALQLRHENLRDALAGDGTASGGSAASVRSTRLRAGMMVAQVAIACVLLVGTALLTRSFAALLTADRGFDPRDVLTVHATMKARPFASDSAGLERIQQRLRALPGVTQAGFGDALPFVTSGGFSGFTLPSPKDPSVSVQAQTIVRTISPEYFPAMGLRLIGGRTLEPTDTATSRPVVMVNKTFAAQYLGPNPIGTVLPVAIGAYRDWEVIGIVDDLRQGGLSGVTRSPFGGVADPPQPELFFTYRQWTGTIAELAFVIRTNANPAALAPVLRNIVKEEEPALAIDSVMTMEDRLMQSLARPRTYAVLLGSFASFALIIAAVGLFGVLSYMTAQRTREIGIRTALGAQAADILRLVTREGVAILIAGLGIGLTTAFLLAGSLRPMLYGVSTHDARTFIVVPIVLAGVVAIACAIPARRATRVNPLTALRYQ
ncbi:MAG TPA: ABC transporter permease [Vicinamibacterales bacterium]